ncbi:response regulator transcription factor [Actinacidiphila alni]|uniref:response regulator transcription factor n=1 Tax=Actinacidiphila alni TaxID=380248 RepID=UPI0034540D7F
MAAVFGRCPVIRVVLADDEHLVRSALRAILDAEPDIDVVGDAATGAEAVSVVRQLRPDVVLMDVRMPQIDGIRATEQILATPTEQPPRVLVVTTFENDSAVYDALRVGAAGFLLKRAGAEELILAVRLVVRGDSVLFPAAVRRLAAEHALRGNAAPPAWAARLTERESAVLRLLAAGLTNMEIGAKLGIGAATAKTHVAAVLAKTGTRDRTQAAIAAYESGFIRTG